MIRKLAHICLATDRLEQVEAFYRKLGLFVQFDFINNDGEKFGYYLGGGDTTFIEIFDRVLRHKQWGSAASQPQPLVQGNQMAHLCLEVTGLAEYREAMVASGLTLTEIRTGMDGSLQSWTADPDGNAVELMEYTHKSWQLQPPKERA